MGDGRLVIHPRRITPRHQNRYTFYYIDKRRGSSEVRGGLLPGTGRRRGILIDCWGVLARLYITHVHVHTYARPTKQSYEDSIKTIASFRTVRVWHRSV